MAREDVIERIEVIGRLGKMHVREAREIYSPWGFGRGNGYPNPPTPWGRARKDSQKTCCYSRSEGYTGSFHCDKVGKLHTDDRYYCGTHNPDKVKAKADARDKAWRAKWDEGTRQRDLATKRDAFRKAAADAIVKIAAGYNDSMGLAREVAAMNPDRDD